MGSRITADQLVAAYMGGYFPMADPDEDDQIYWYAPDPRAIIPLEDFRISRSLRSTLRREQYSVRVNTSFESVIEACADRDETWISREIRELYLELHSLGVAHSVETWEDEQLTGGLYGIAINGLFCGESMFSVKSDASKVALVSLVKRLRDNQFELLDIQFMTEHLRGFGAIEITKSEYEERLRQALAVQTSWI